VKRRTLLELGLTGIGAVAMSDKAWALKYYPNASDKKWAVLYATWCGSARDAAVWISEGMGGIADSFDVRENPDLSQFDHIIVGSAIRSGKVKPEIQQYLEKNRQSIKDKVRGLYTVCGNMQKPVTPEVIKSQITDQMAPLCGAKDVPAHVFLGRVTPILLEPAVRDMMKAMGEYDNLKRADCMAFGKEVLGRL
jgi:menaquinone-dependent protoporphyrinogen oxidase